MNLLLFDAKNLQDTNTLTVSGRHQRHIHETLKLEVGHHLRVGQLGGKIGIGTVTHTNQASTTLSVTLDTSPPPPIPIKLVMALPRPKMLRRVLQSVASLGIKEIHLINSYRVEKSFWQSPWLEQQALREQLILGLEQSGDTCLPALTLHKRFKPFVEDELPEIIVGTRPLVAHPYTDMACPTAPETPVTLAVGPEGGFINYEVDKLKACGFQPISLGPRILRVETAIPVLVARLTPAVGE